MSTATVPLTITCPEWCTRTPEEHVGELWDYGGNCIHHSATMFALDTVGYREPMQEPRFHSPIEVLMTAQSRPEGQESASPVVHLEGRELSPAQALALADVLRETVETYRASGGAE